MVVPPSQDGLAALHAACQEGHDCVVEMLLQFGAIVQEKTKVKCKQINNSMLYDLINYSLCNFANSKHPTLMIIFCHQSANSI